MYNRIKSTNKRREWQEDVSVWLPENAHLSLDVNRDGQQQRHVEAHFQQVIPVMSWIHGLRDDRNADLHTRVHVLVHATYRVAKMHSSPQRDRNTRMNVCFWHFLFVLTQIWTCMVFWRWRGPLKAAFVVRALRIPHDWTLAAWLCLLKLERPDASFAFP